MSTAKEAAKSLGVWVHFYEHPPFDDPVCGQTEWHVCTTDRGEVNCPGCKAWMEKNPAQWRLRA